MEQNIGKDLTVGPVAKSLLLFSLPFMVSTILQSLYAMTDTIIVGQYLGQSGLSAVGNASQIMTMLYSVIIGFCNGGQVLIAQAKGAKKENRLQRLIETLFCMILLASVLIGTASIFFVKQILAVMQTPTPAWSSARDYIIICGAGIFFTGLYNMFSAVFRGLGDSRHPLIFVFIATLLNIVLDILFVSHGLGVAGAAYATVIGQAASVMFSIFYLKRHERQFVARFNLLRYRPDSDSCLMIAKLGIPMAFQMCAVQISFLFVARMINALGVTVSAAFNVMQKIRSLPGFLTQGFGMGAASMMGQNLGAGKQDRVSKVVRFTILFTLVVDVTFGILYLSIPNLLFRLFTQDSSVLTYAAMCTLVLAIELPANVFMPACNSLVSAQGFIRLSFTVAILDAFVGRIFFCWFLGACCHLGAFGYFLGYVIGTYVTSIIVATYYFSGWWKKREALVSQQK